MKKYAIIGFGGLGKMHFLNLLKLQEERKDMMLTAICNSDLDAIKKSMKLNIGAVSMEEIDFSKYHLYTDYQEMIEKEDLDFVFIALPSHLHCEVAVYCLEHGLHTYSEKPMAITMEQCEQMLQAAEKSGKKLMVGQSLRFCDEYRFLKEAVEKNTYGKVIKAEFSRKSPLPDWSFQNWLLDEKRSGGCLVDMHVHDVDVMVWLFGKPEEMHVVSSHKMAEYESVYAVYRYPEHVVSIIGDWGLHTSFAFRDFYGVTFEKAYVEYRDGKVTVYTNEGKEEITFSGESELVRAETEFVEAVVDGKPFATADVSTVYETMKLVFAEKEAAAGSVNRKGGKL